MNNLCPVVAEENGVQKVDKSELREFVTALQSDLAELPQQQIEIKHHFSYGIYAREMIMPPEVVVIGKIHKFQSLNILSKGEVSVLDCGDGSVRRVRAPYTVVSEPGAKRVIYSFEETIWTTIHGTFEKDLEKIEAHFIANDFNEVDTISEEDFKKMKEAVCLG